MEEIIRDLDRLRNYFRYYNEQVRQVPGISGLCDVDFSGSLGSIVENIFDKERWKDACFVPNNYTCRYRNEFCIEVLLYFLDTGNVPEFNVNEVVEKAREKLPQPIGKSFEKFINIIRKLRGVKEKTVKSKESYESCE